jgi:hypothetical protein
MTHRLLVLGVLAVCLAGCGLGGTSSITENMSLYRPNLWPARPQVSLAYTVAPDLRSVAGRETGTFTPDLRTCELVFRAWPNNPTMAEAGDSLTVTDAAVNGQPAVLQAEAAGAPESAPPTLLRAAIPGCANAGQAVRFDLQFRVQVGKDADERIGYSPDTRTAWFGSAFPMLSWVRGTGWTTDPAVQMNGETTTSEEFSLSLSVTAPTGLVVQGVGARQGTTAGPTAGTTTHRFAADAVRDVAVAVGDYQVLDQTVNGVSLHLATPTSGSKTEPSVWVDQLSRSMVGLSRLLGPFPYQDFWVTLTPGQGDGTEFPGALQFSDAKNKELPALVTHEVAHQWFYALVGNNQARNPWLDEAFATYGEAMVGGDADEYRSADIPSKVQGRMGEPMSYWVDHGGFDRYTEGVYNQGAQVLLKARETVGADAFDEALRGYVVANAHRVASPNDVARAFRSVPEVISLLRQAGTLPSPA